MENTEEKYICEIMSDGAEMTERVGAELGKLAFKGLYIALRGELGGGKTTFVKGLAAGMEVTENVSSPTFVLMREYDGAIPLFHADYYRLEKEAELTPLEIDDCLRRGVVAAEWADKFPLPEGSVVLLIDFKWHTENLRILSITAASESARNIAADFADAIKPAI